MPTIFEFLMSQFVKEPQRLAWRERLFVRKMVTIRRVTVSRARHTSLVSVRCSGVNVSSEIGGYKPNKAGGIDWMAVTTCPNDGLEDTIFSREVILSSPEARNSRAWPSCIKLFVRRKGLLSRRASDLGDVSGRLRMTKPPFLVDGAALGLRIRMGFHIPPEASRFQRTDAVSPQGTDAKASRYSWVNAQIWTRRQFSA